MKSTHKLMRLCMTCFAVIALVLAVGSTARADSLDFGNGLTADGTLTTGAGTFTLTFSITNSNSADAGIYDFSLQLLGGSGTITINSASGSGTTITGFEYFDGYKQNNGATDYCSNSGHPNWMCVDYSGDLTNNPGHFAVIPGEGSLTYTFSGTYTGTPVGVLDLMAQGCDEVDGTNCVYNGAGSFNISHPMDGTVIPEPSSLLLFGTGLLGMAGYLRRRLL